MTNIRKEILERTFKRERKKTLDYSQFVDNVTVSKSDNIERIIFAPDPVTGLPMSDLSLREDIFRDAAVQDYVDKVLHRDMSGRVEKGVTKDVDGVSPDDIMPRACQTSAERRAFILGLKERVEKVYQERSKE